MHIAWTYFCMPTIDVVTLSTAIFSALGNVVVSIVLAMAASSTGIWQGVCPCGSAGSLCFPDALDDDAARTIDRDELTKHIPSFLDNRSWH
jgi:hypothetical protein